MEEKVTIQFKLSMKVFDALCFHLGTELTDDMKAKLLEKPCELDTDKFEDQKQVMEMALAALAIGSIKD